MNYHLIMKTVFIILYNKSNFDNIKNNFYPGNNTLYNKGYSNIMKHFKSKSNEGCYVYLCKNWFYHSIPSGFPGYEEIDKKCPNCGKPIGSDKKDL